MYIVGLQKCAKFRELFFGLSRSVATGILRTSGVAKNRSTTPPTSCRRARPPHRVSYPVAFRGYLQNASQGILRPVYGIPPFSVERIIDRVFPVSGSPLVVFTTGIHTIRCLHVTAASHSTDGVFRPLWCSPSLDSSEVDAAALGQVLCQGVWLFTASCSSGGGGWHPPDGAFPLFGFRGVITSRPF